MASWSSVHSYTPASWLLSCRRAPPASVLVHRHLAVGPWPPDPAQGVAVGVDQELVEAPVLDLGLLGVGERAFAHRDGRLVADGPGGLGQEPVREDPVDLRADLGLQQERGVPGAGRPTG